jgi:hypothetical protein
MLVGILSLGNDAKAGFKATCLRDVIDLIPSENTSQTSGRRKRPFLAALSVGS